MSATDKLDKLATYAKDTTSIVRVAYNHRTVVPHPDDEWAWAEGMRAGIGATLASLGVDALVAALQAVLEVTSDSLAEYPDDITALAVNRAIEEKLS